MTAKSSEKGSRLRVGTSGYSYPEWIEAGFYPPKTPSAHMLGLYARAFPVTELNYTWYQIPKAAPLSRMRELVPVEFRFAAKLTRTLTHEVEPDQWRDQVSLGAGIKYGGGIVLKVEKRSRIRTMFSDAVEPIEFYRMV